jgi:hypothetical protein
MGVRVVSVVTEVTRLACDRTPRIALLTDAASAEMVPESIREVVDETHFGNLSWIGGAKIPDGLDGAVVWCKGEVPLAGSPADWRRSFFSQPAENGLVAVHWPYLEHADLL